MPKSTNVLILGASRGLGFAMAAEWCSRGAHLIATVRKPSAPLSALADRYPASLTIKNADLDDAASIRALRIELGDAPLDILFVNAGVALGLGKSAADIVEADMLAMMRTNALGPVRALEILSDLVPKGGVLAVMSSELGSIANSGGGHWAFYSASKAALNMLVSGYSAQHGEERAVMLVCPGWIRTDMGGAAATYSIDEAIPAVVDMVTAQQGRPGFRFVDRFGKTLPW